MVNKSVFSICIGNRDLGENGYMNIGGVDTTYHDKADDLFYLHYFRSIGAYRIFLESFQYSNSDKKIPVIYNYYGVLDSNTFKTKLPEQIYNEIISNMENFCKNSNLCKYNFGGGRNPCFKDKAADLEYLLNTLPSIKTSFRDSQNNLLIKTWLPQNYLYSSDQGICMAIESWK